jgi:hypothetical protein
MLDFLGEHFGIDIAVQYIKLILVKFPPVVTPQH